MGIEKWHAAIDQPQTLPHAVAENEAGVEHGDHGLVAGIERAVDGDEDIRVARINFDVVEGLGHGQPLYRRRFQRQVSA